MSLLHKEPWQTVSLRIPMLVVLVFKLQLFWAAAELGPPASAASPLESFKRFMSDPPIIESAVYRTISSGSAARGLPMGEGGHGSNDAVIYFHARWQPACLFLKTGTNLDVVSPERQPFQQVDARFYKDYWRLDRAGFLTTWQDSARTPGESGLQPSRVFHMSTHQFKEMMNMGIMQIEVGAVKWHGDRLEAEGYVPEWKTPVRVEGQVVPDTNGYAKELRVTYRSRMGVYNYALRYSYHEDVGLSFLPNVIQSFFIWPDGEVKLMECQIYSIKTASTPLPRASFDLEPLLASKEMPRILFTNGAWYARNLVGGWAPIRSPSGELAGFAPAPSRLLGRGTYYCAVVTMTIIAFTLILKAGPPGSRHKLAKTVRLKSKLLFP